MPLGVVFCLSPGHAASLRLPLAYPPYGLVCLPHCNSILELEFVYSFCIFPGAYTCVSAKLFKLTIACFKKSYGLSEHT